MSEKIVSVILPIYNVSDYLCECIDSVMKQTYKNLEIILVDDGSTDSCPQICDAYANKDNRIKVIHKKNGGLSDARNVGIESSTGDYIALVDSDDVISPFFIEELYKTCEINGATIAACKFIKFNKITEIKKTIKFENTELISGRELIKNIYKGIACDYGFTAWNKLYNRHLFDSIKYPFGRIYEDTFTTYQLYFKARKVALIDTPLYFYRMRPKSIMSSELSFKKIKDGVDADASVVKFFYNKDDSELLELASSYFCMETLRTYFKDIKTVKKEEYSDSKKYLKETYNETWNYCRQSNIGFVKKILFSLIKVFL